jgi:hypothetical protein
MAVKTFTSATLSSSDTNTYLANAGLVFVKQVTTGSTGVATVDVTSCFNSTYENYFVTFNYLNWTTGGSLNWFLLSGSTPTSTGMYGTEYFININTTTQNGQITGNNVGSCFCSSGTTTSGIASTMEVQAPFVAQYTRMEYKSIDSTYYRYGFGIHQAATSYDGFRVTCSSGTISNGSITVYGCRKG